MLSTSILVLRVLLVFSLGAAFLAPRLLDLSPAWRKSGLIAAAVITILLLGARFGLRATEPGNLPAPNG